MNAIDLLTQQHRDVERLFERIEQETDVRMKVESFNELADILAVHTAVEERIFYPTVRERRTEETLEAAVEDHQEMKRLLAELLQDTLAVAQSGSAFGDTVFQLMREVSHHVQAEEDQLFPVVRAMFDNEQLDALGQSMTALMVELEEKGSPRNDIFNELDEAVRA